MLLFYNCYKTVSGHFFATCVFIFHKTEVQTVILRCLMGLNCNWFKSYGLRCSRRPRASSVNFWKVASDKWPFYDHIWPLFWKLHDYLWQNWDSDGHLEVLNKSKSELVQKLWHKTQKRKKCKFVFLYKIAKERKWKYLHFVS